jgi:hypothetical protein
MEPNAPDDKGAAPLKSAREAMGIDDRSDAAANAYLRALEGISRRRSIKGATTDEIIVMTRGEPTPPPRPAAPGRRGARS